MGVHMVRVDAELYNRMQEYAQEMGVPVVRAMNEAVQTFLECVAHPRLEFVRQQKSSTANRTLKLTSQFETILERMLS